MLGRRPWPMCLTVSAGVVSDGMTFPKECFGDSVCCDGGADRFVC